MNKKTILSIITATRGNFSEFWLEQLLKIKGDIEFILVYPPDAMPSTISDSRVKILKSPYKSETMQRAIGLVNAMGKYVLALDDDDFLHPDLLRLTTEYFNRFPHSWVLRLRMAKIDNNDKEWIEQSWKGIPDISQLPVYKKTEKESHPFKERNYRGLLEVPIAPLDKRFNIGWLFWPFMERKDQHGMHMENFNNRVWKNDIVQKAILDLLKTTRIAGPLTWMPPLLSGFDRTLGLFLQAKFFKRNMTIGHWMPEPEQIRKINYSLKTAPPRFHILSHILLIKRFPQYGYLWNLFFSTLYGTPRMMGKAIKYKILKIK